MSLIHASVVNHFNVSVTSTEDRMRMEPSFYKLNTNHGSSPINEETCLTKFLRLRTPTCGFSFAIPVSVSAVSIFSLILILQARFYLFCRINATAGSRCSLLVLSKRHIRSIRRADDFMQCAYSISPLKGRS